MNKRHFIAIILLGLFVFLDLFWSSELGFHCITEWFYDFRLPRVLAAVLGGAALALSGAVLQTLFRNPLAGPFLTGITPGSVFAVGCLLLLFPNGIENELFQNIGLTTAGMLGGALVLLLQLFISRRHSGIFTLLLVGVMLGYLLGAGVEIMQTFAGAEQIKSFVMWGMGNFDRVQLNDIYWFGTLTIMGTAVVFLNRFKLDTWLPGNLYAVNAGINPSSFKLQMILITAILAGSTTALCGPIGFVGMAAPHIARMSSQSAVHRKFLLPTAIWGSTLCVFADLLAHNIIPGLSVNVNAICAITGAPVVLWVILRNRRLTAE